MNYLSAENLVRSYGTKVLFEDLTFGISQGQKIALVGRNGCGKTTLLRILGGVDQPDSGSVSLRKGIRLEFLQQAPQFPGAQTVLDAVFSGDDPVLSAVREYRKLSQGQVQDPDRFQQIMDQMEATQAWDYETRVGEILGKLGIHRLDQPIAELSGGQRKRVALARVLVHEPDFLILDEPTNHLDTDSIEWLENHLAASKLTLILVTHDRYFLDRVCNEIIELDQGNVHRYQGNYEHFLEKKAERQDKDNMDVARARNLLRKELEWLRRQPKARTTKSKARIDSVHGLMEDARKGPQESGLNMNFKARRLGGKILELEDLSKSYGELHLVKDFTYTFKKKERIGIVGPNGVGKSTFLNLITGRLEPDTGTVVAGETIHFGYYTQGGLSFKPGQLVLDVITEAAEHITLGNGDKLSASAVLTLFGFPPATQRNHVSELSGGEKRRLYLLRVLMEQPNFLILDEPTNDLDIVTLNTLEEFLMGFGGCLLIVSHDRYFLNKLCDHLFAFEGEGNIRDFPGNYSQYREVRARELEEETREKTETPVKKDTRVRHNEVRKLTFKETREYEQLEADIGDLEEKRETLLAQINAGSTDYEALSSWGEELKAVETELETKSDRWLELAEILEESQG